MARLTLPESETPDPCDARQRICENGYWVQPTLADECEPVALEDASMESDGEPDVGADDEPMMSLMRVSAMILSQTVRLMQQRQTRIQCSIRHSMMLNGINDDGRRRRRWIRWGAFNVVQWLPEFRRLSVGVGVYAAFFLLLVLGRRRIRA